MNETAVFVAAEALYLAICGLLMACSFWRELEEKVKEKDSEGSC